MRGALADRLHVLQDIADGKAIRRVVIGESETEAWVSPDPADRIRALDMLARYGLGTQREITGAPDVPLKLMVVREDARPE